MGEIYCSKQEAMYEAEGSTKKPESRTLCDWIFESLFENFRFIPDISYNVQEIQEIKIHRIPESRVNP